MVVILVIAILATATFLGGATVIKQSRKSKVQTNLSNYAAYVQDMLYAEPGVINKTENDVKTLLNSKYLTKDFQLGETKDAWNTPYEFYFTTDTVDQHKCTYVVISSDGPNGSKESYDLLTKLIENDHVSAQAALDSNTLMTGDDLGLVVLLRDGAVSSADYGFEKASAAPTAITMLDGVNQVYNGTAPLVFRSSANIHTFQEVRVDSEVVAPANYTVTEGSTIITFTEAYAKTLVNGTHKVEIMSTIGLASTDFKVEIPNTVAVKTGTMINSDFSTLKTISSEIANEINLNNEQITVKYNVAIGDTIQIDGITCYIADFNHDIVNGETGITLIANTEIVHSANANKSNIGGWTSSEIRSYIQNTDFTNLYPTISNNAKVVMKKSDIGNKNTTTLNTTQDKLWLFSFEEVFPNDYAYYEYCLTNFVVSGQGTIYPIFTADNNSRILISSSWLRSSVKNTNTNFLDIISNGKHYINSTSDTECKIVIGFCI